MDKEKKNNIKEILKKRIDDFKFRVIAVRKQNFDFEIKIDEKSIEYIYKKAVYLAYQDAKRALVGITKTNNVDDPKKIKEKELALENLKNEIKKYFKEKSACFDHHKFCDILINSFKKYKLTYGAAQKIVNLTFKYLYCFTNFKKRYKDKFANCHMVMDSYIIQWYVKNVRVNNTNTLKANSSWSKLDDYDSYSSAQRDILQYINAKNLDLSVLEYEFILWPYTLFYTSAINWYKSLVEDERNTIYDAYPLCRLNDLIEQISLKCNEYLNSNMDNDLFNDFFNR